MQEVEATEPVDTSSITNSRNKRFAPFGFFGTVRKAFFGTLTQEDGERYNQQIETLFKGQTDLARIGKEETHIVQHKLAKVTSEIEMIKSSIEKQFTVYKDLREEYTDLDNEVEGLKYSFGLSSVLAELDAIISLYQATFSKLLRAIIDARHGRLDPSLLSTETLQKIIRQIADYHLQYEFPIPIAHARTDKLADVSPVKLAYRFEKFFLEVNVPMLDKFPTELHKIHPLPTPQGKASAFIKPQADFLTLSHDKRTYSLISKEDLTNCHHTKHHQICYHNKPIHETDDNNDILLNQPYAGNFEKCDIHVLNFQRDYFTLAPVIVGYFPYLKKQPCELSAQDNMIHLFL